MLKLNLLARLTLLSSLLGGSVVFAADATYPDMLKEIKSVEFTSSTRQGDYQVTITFPDQLKGWENSYSSRETGLRVGFDPKDAELVTITYVLDGKVTQRTTASAIYYRESGLRDPESKEGTDLNFEVTDRKVGIRYEVSSYNHVPKLNERIIDGTFFEGNDLVKDAVTPKLIRRSR